MSGLDAIAGVYEITSPTQMEQFGQRIGAELGAGDVVVLTGRLGAGKTTLTRGIAAGLGVRGPVQSPTFVIARTHPSLVGGPALIHVDAYRLSSGAELADLDLDLSGAVVIVEWGGAVVAAIAAQWWEIELEVTSVDRDADLDAPAPRTVTITRRREPATS